MRVLALELRNIRSYTHIRAQLPAGVVLLCGDIGAGKSTLLLALEFALFGIARGELSGSALLRHGAKDGSVHATVQIGDQTHVIMRTLKRTPTGIVQDACWIETQGVREQLTPAELRARVFLLLGYPLHFLGKQRNLLYRFTVYTPQEELKSILLQQGEERLEAIRRVFGVDTYRQVRENAQLIVKTFKDREAEHAVRIAQGEEDIARLHKELSAGAQVQARKETVLASRTQTQEQAKLAQDSVQRAQEQQVAIAKEYQALLTQAQARKAAAQQLQRLAASLSQEYARRTAAQEALTRANVLHANLQRDLAGTDPATISVALEEARRRIEQCMQEEGKLLAIIEEKSAMQFSPGSLCPTCKQTVDEQHLATVHMAMFARQDAARRKKEKLRATLQEARAAFALHTTQARTAQDLTAAQGRIAMHEEALRSIDAQIAILTRMHDEKQQDVSPAAQAHDEERLRTQSMLAAQNLANAQQIFTEAQTRLLAIERALATIEEQERTLARTHETAAAHDLRLANDRQALANAQRMRNWVSQQFMPVAEHIERRVLGAVHGAIHRAFRMWCSQMLEDDEMSVRIDEQFTPLIVQNGYETDVIHLSGGERTAVSLAYRLALVHAIHELLPHLGTAGLLVLDEPTEGFSREQLERLCEVLRTLRMEQIILVSHEPLLEGMVDHVLRVERIASGSAIHGDLAQEPI